MTIYPSGFNYPFRIASTGGIAKTDGATKVVANLKALVKSSLNERVIRKAVGTISYALLFRTDIKTHATTVENFILEAITAWEPRATAVQVTAYPDETTSDAKGIIDVSFVFKDTGTPAQFAVSV